MKKVAIVTDGWVGEVTYAWFKGIRQYLDSRGLDADLYFFPETYCAKYVKAGPTGAGGDNDPVYFENAEYLDTPNGSCLKLSNISGGVALYMPEEKYCR